MEEEDDILACPYCGEESFFEMCKVTRVQTGRLTKDGFNADDDFPADYQEDDSAPERSYMCTSCHTEWSNLNELLAAVAAKK